MAAHAEVPHHHRPGTTRLLELAIRLYGTPATHRLLPAAVALPLVAALEPAARARRIPAERLEVERLMSDLLQYTPRRDEAMEAARRQLREQSRLRELFWRPWLLKRSRLAGREHWDAAHRDGRGCVLVLGHFGGSWAISGILARHGLDVHMVSSAHFWGELPPGLTGRMHRRLREYGEQALGAERLIPNDAPPERVLDLIAAGETIGIAFDVPGSAATPFLGRAVALTSGPATLAFHAGAMVLPVISERHGTRIDLRLLEPLDATEYRDLRSLRAAIARTYEPLVVAKPEIVEMPWNPSPLVTESVSSRAMEAPRVGV